MQGVPWSPALRASRRHPHGPGHSPPSPQSSAKSKAERAVRAIGRRFWKVRSYRQGEKWTWGGEGSNQRSPLPAWAWGLRVLGMPACARLAWAEGQPGPQRGAASQQGGSLPPIQAQRRPRGQLRGSCSPSARPRGLTPRGQLTLNAAARLPAPDKAPHRSGRPRLLESSQRRVSRPPPPQVSRGHDDAMSLLKGSRFPWRTDGPC